jgi:hypothetical protein
MSDLLNNLKAPVELGHLIISLNLDTGKMEVGFSNESSSRLVSQEEIPLLFSPLIMGLIIHLIQVRSKSIIAT